MWTQLNGDTYARSPIRDAGQPLGGNTGVGVRMPTGLELGLDPPGGYGSRGPIVKVAGVWKHHDPARQGESYLEATSLAVAEPGRPLNQDPQWVVILVGLGLIAASVLLHAWRRDETNRSDVETLQAVSAEH